MLFRLQRALIAMLALFLVMSTLQAAPPPDPDAVTRFSHLSVAGTFFRHSPELDLIFTKLSRRYPDFFPSHLPVMNKKSFQELLDPPAVRAEREKMNHQLELMETIADSAGVAWSEISFEALRILSQRYLAMTADTDEIQFLHPSAGSDALGFPTEDTAPLYAPQRLWHLVLARGFMRGDPRPAIKHSPDLMRKFRRTVGEELPALDPYSGQTLEWLDAWMNDPFLGFDPFFVAKLSEQSRNLLEVAAEPFWHEQFIESKQVLAQFFQSGAEQVRKAYGQMEALEFDRSLEFAAGIAPKSALQNTDGTWSRLIRRLKNVCTTFLE